MLGYRSLFDVDQTGVVDTVRAQLHSWLRHKNYDADALVDNGDVAQIGLNAEAVMTSEDLQDGSRSSLFTLRESGDKSGAWISQVIAHEPAHGRARPWVWIDIEQEGAQIRQAAIPNLARGLLSVLDAWDGGASLGASPARVGVEDVPELVAALESRTRRGPVFVAGSSDQLPLARWSEYVGKLLKDTVGLAAGYVLDAAATEALSDHIGVRHAVAPGTLRTYLPGLDPGSDLDALRHRFLTTETILSSPRGRIEKNLGQRARDIALAAPIPRWAARVESKLLAETDGRVLGWKPTALVEPIADIKPRTSPQTQLRPQPVPSSAEVSPSTATASQAHPAEPLPAPPSVLTPLADLAKTAQALFGTELDEPLLRKLAIGQSALLQAQAEMTSMEATIDRLSRRSLQLNERVLSLEESVAAVRRESDDAQLEWAEATDEVTQLERTVRELQNRLAKEQSDDAWLPIPAPSGVEIIPDSFASLLVRLHEFAYVRFTGDPGAAEALDTHQPYWASKVWMALLTLEDYARGTKEGLVNVGVDQYLQQTPDGLATFSANRHARDESKEVKKNPKFTEARTFPVPKSVDSRGAVFMGAHFKIAQFGMVSPRLHYFDATASDAKIYVGYIGVHLPTGMTN